MLTFLDFYQTMLQFVNFKLYHMLGLAYPPVMDTRLEEAARGLASIIHELGPPDSSSVEGAQPLSSPLYGMKTNKIRCQECNLV